MNPLTPSVIRSNLNSVREDVDRIEKELIVADHHRKQLKREKYVQTLFETFVERRRELLNMLAEGSSGYSVP